MQRDYDSIRQQLVTLKETGHDIQLHLHPHWLDSSYDGSQWQINTNRYKLHDFPTVEITKIVSSGKKILTDLVGDTVFAFRAGGWCLQPFTEISTALKQNSIWLDSTVYRGGLSDDDERWFDFSVAPLKSYWRFSTDPNKEDKDGTFIEIPISAMQLTPLFFWRMALRRKLMSQTAHKTYGDGTPLSYGARYYLQRLTRSTVSVASMDGLKAGLLNKAFHDEQASGKQLFHAIGHPKAMTDYSLTQLENFLHKRKNITSVTFQDFGHLRPSQKNSSTLT
ncbi:polysaccharide deacetylase family protein [Desulfopila aestuarii]|uniref:hypothetical protein n=1 Tax=Desulfopila aestuarii TaxID=231440 RepID=UPI0011611CC1|nr:hypothetical protein [Desulfopila aestuarii]